MTEMGQKCPKPLRLPAGKNTDEHMGRIVPRKDPSDSASQIGWRLLCEILRNGRNGELITCPGTGHPNAESAQTPMSTIITLGTLRTCSPH